MSIIKKNKGITLIALIVTIVVLLILAGVTINAITGSESAMEKATEAREKDKQGTELEAIKLAVVNSVASDLTGLVNADNLKDGLNGVVEDEGRLAINSNNSPWQVTGKTGKTYEISQNGNVEVITGVILSTKNLTLEIKDDTYGEETITARLVDIEGNLTWTTSSNIIDITPSSNGLSATIKAVSGGNAKITVECSTGDKAECNVIVNEKAIPKYGDYIDFKNNLIGTESSADDWIILCNGTNSQDDVIGGKIYAILADYLPAQYVPTTGTYLSTSGTYAVYSNSQSHLVNGLKHETAWMPLISSEITDFYTNIKVFGAIDGTPISGTLGKIYSKNDWKLNKIDYVPHDEIYNNIQGYWLAEPNTNYSENKYIRSVGYDKELKGDQGTNKYDMKNYGVCPIVILPQDVQLEKNPNGIWEVVIPGNT